MRTYDKKKYIEFLKQDLLSKAFPPSFEGDYSYYSRYHYLYNCYSYALQLSMDEDEIAKNEKNRIKYGALEASSKCEYVYTPGFTVRDNTHLQDEKMIEDYLLEDCDKLGIPIRKINTMTCSKQD